MRGWHVVYCCNRECCVCQSQLEAMQEANEALRVSLASSCTATLAAEERTRKAENEAEESHAQVLQLEIANKELERDLANARERSQRQTARVSEAESEIETLNTQLREQAIQLAQATEMKKSYQGQLEDAQQLMVPIPCYVDSETGDVGLSAPAYGFA